MGLTRCCKAEGFFTFIMIIRPQSLTLFGVLRSVKTLYPLAECRCNCYVMHQKRAFCHAVADVYYTRDCVSGGSVITLMADELLAVRGNVSPLLPLVALRY